MEKHKRSCMKNCNNYSSCTRSDVQTAWDCMQYVPKLSENKKESNPKYSAGVKKVPTHCIPTGPLFELGLAMFEGSRKYGRHNYRAIGVRASTYYDAIDRHLKAWLEGEDLDPDSGVHHLIKIMACCAVVRDSMLMGNFNDDRPLRYPDGLDMAKFNKQAGDLIEKYPDCEKPFLETNKDEK